MLNDKEEITLKDKEGKPITITVDVPTEPQPQVLFESFNRHELYRPNDESDDEDE